VINNIREQKFNLILMDGGLAINIMPKSIMHDLGIMVEELPKSQMVIQGFTVEC